MGGRHQRRGRLRAELSYDRRHRSQDFQGLWHVAGFDLGHLGGPHAGRQSDRAQRLHRRAGQENQADPGLPDEHRPQFRRGAARARLVATHRQAPRLNAGELEARRGCDPRRRHYRRRSQKALSRRLENAEALYPHRAAAEGLTWHKDCAIRARHSHRALIICVMTDLGFIHRFIPATRPGLPPLLLLHGTGGDENDLVALGEQLSPGAALLSPRGKVTENGMPRFFRRLAEGVFDQTDLKLRTAELGEFITTARKQYGIEAPVAVGFSNGANIAASLLLTEPDVLRGAVLLRAMLPFDPQPPPDLAGKPVLLLSGSSDPMISAAGRDRLVAVLQTAGAALTHKVLPTGHNLTQNDLTIAGHWLEQLQ